MRYFLLLFYIITHIVCVSGENFVESEQTLLSGSYTGRTVDTLLFPIKEDRDNEIRKEVPPSALFLKKPSNIKDTIVYDPSTKRYVVKSLIGGRYDYVRPYSQTLQELIDTRSKMSIYEYNRRQIQEGSKYDFKSLVSEIQFLDKLLSPIFGKNKIKINVQGSVELTLGVKTNKIDNPTLPIDMRKTTTLDFDEKIQFNIGGNIGDLINLDWSYNTEATFDFENILKLNYEGKEDDIVKKVEAGNVSLPLSGTLISGGQNLWGFRTDLQFGKLSVSGIFSQQKGEAKMVQLEKGGQKQEFEVSANNYEANRHFFLSRYFRDTYDASLQNLPVINSGVVITKIEVWVTNKNSRFEQARNIVAFTGLAENNIGDPKRPMFNARLFPPVAGQVYPDNRSNQMYADMKGKYGAIRDINSVSGVLSKIDATFNSGKDYEKLENARLLDPSEYVLNDKLGYISLNSALNADEVLAVAYEYTLRGEVHTVGELTFNAPPAPSTLIVKMLRSTTQSPQMPTWDLMMKNVYNIGSYNLSSDDFVLDILYQNDKAGTKVNYLPVGDINNKILLAVMNLDRLNSQLDAIPDGRVDYVEGMTVFSNKGRIVFPVLEPFGSYLKKKISSAAADNYVFQDLYDKTQSEAEQNAEKNKFYLKGSYKSSSSSEISLGGGDIPQGSVKVLAGGVELTENIDYTVDYTMGSVTIINQSLLEAGTPITIKSENRSSFGMQTKTLVGTHLDYRFNDKFNIGATIMHLSEKPLTHKVNLGEEPLSNTIWGFNATYNTESGFLTTLVDKLPFIHTKAKSHLTIDTEFAKFQPGTAKGAGDNAYLDDFEGSKISLDMKAVTQWKLASTPQDDMFPEGSSDSLTYGYNRAKLSWYVVDPIFYRMSTATPSHIRSDKEQRSNHFVREIRQTEIFPQKDLAVGDVNIIPALSVAYYPTEKGPYNFSTDVDRNGRLKDPEKHWGGMMRSISTSDFEAANVQYIEIWLMDPFVYNQQHKGGDVYFDLGNMSEDILKDGRKSFENGLPTSPTPIHIDTTIWGRVPSVQSITNGFDNNSQARRFQDVGLDGMNDEEERVFYAKYLNSLRNLYGENSTMFQDAWNDPAGDNYHFFRGSDYDAMEIPVLLRYKRFNGTEGNSPTADMSPESYPTAATTLPDVEDINGDNTLNETEAFFRYHLDLRPEKMKVGENYISDVTTAQVELPNGVTEEVKWYQIKIPLSKYISNSNGKISDFKSIRFMRMIMKGFQDSVILRMASLDLVRDNWRKYDGNLEEQISSNKTVFDVSVVSLEENSSRTPVNYVMPPGIDRVVDATNPQLRELNEQAMSLQIKDLQEGDSRAVYKTFGKDLLRYKTLRMDVHAEALKESTLGDDELTLFLRLGTDNLNNYYEYEIPLKLTAPGYYGSDYTGRISVWPDGNRIELPLRWLQTLKQKRNSDARAAGQEVDYLKVTEMLVGDLDHTAGAGQMGHTVKVKGKPTLGDIRNIMIGIRNPKGELIKGERSAEVWVNELRLSDFDNKGGWAANARVTAKLADVATISFAGSRMTPGFGSIEQHAGEIEREDFRSLDFSTSVEFGKFFPEKWRLRIPMYYAYSRQSTLPEYDPTDTDIPLDVAMDNAANKHIRDSIKHNAEDYMMRKSLNFTNVGFESRDGKSHFFDWSNLTLTYSYNKSFARNVNIERDLEKNYRGLISYIYNGMPKIVEPFKDSKALDSKYLKLIKDFNFYYMPSMLSVTSDITRNYREIESKNLDNPNLLITPTYDKDFTWTRDYAFKFNLTKNLVIDFHATAQARIDEPEGIVDKQRDPERYQQWKDTVLHNILDGGRPVNYNHDFSIQYTVPINKLPFLDWTSLQTAYSTRYDWQAAALTDDSTNFGNVIRNANSLQLNGDLSLTTLYNKSTFLRNLSRPPRPQKGKVVKFETQIEQLVKGKPLIIKHRLKTGDIKATLTSVDGKSVKLGYESIGRNKIRINSSQTLEGSKLFVTGTETSNVGAGNATLRFFMGILMGIKNINIGYSEDKGTTLPGFLPEARWLGQQSFKGTSAPGFNFLFGGQKEHFGLEAAQKGWITSDSSQNNPFLMN
ncbi:MAG: cell surface protein SprA, partial [Odoribacter sp.]